MPARKPAPDQIDAPTARRRTRVARRPGVPAQRPSGLELLGLTVEELAVDDHEARDARLFDALDWQDG